MPTHCPNCPTTNSEHYISSARFSLPMLRGWRASPLPRPKNHSFPHLTYQNITTYDPDLPIHHPHHHQVHVRPFNHATTCVLEHNTPPPSPMPTPANLWNTATSWPIPPLAKSGFTLPPTNLDDLPKAFLTIASMPPTPSSLYPSSKSHAPNARPTHALSAVFARKKLEPYRTRITVGGNLIDYPGNLSMKVADMTTFKILVNSTLSTPGAKWLGLDVKNYYLGTPMDNYEYMFIPLNQIPQEIIDHYNLHNIVHKGKVYIEIRRGMYGLPQAGILTETQLIHFLGKYGYSPAPHTPGLWRHQWRPITFCLVVDDFGIKYVGRKHADHLIQCLRNHYKKLDIDWAGKCFCGIHLNWDYINRTCDLSMPGYVDHALHKFQHPTPKKPQDSPYPATVKQYGVKVQLTDPIDTSVRLPPHEIKRLQQIIGTFLFYGRALDPTLLTALSELSSAQATATDATKRACQQFLDYCASHPDGAIRYQASDMILKLHSDSSYLNAVGARSHQGGHLYLGNKSEPHHENGPLLCS